MKIFLKIIIKQIFVKKIINNLCINELNELLTLSFILHICCEMENISINSSPSFFFFFF